METTRRAIRIEGSMMFSRVERSCSLPSAHLFPSSATTGTWNTSGLLLKNAHKYDQCTTTPSLKQTAQNAEPVHSIFEELILSLMSSTLLRVSSEV